METKHTPGPYHAEPNYLSTGWYVKQTSHCRELATVNQRLAGIERDECEANAHLFAAAPALLEACEGLLKRYVGLVESGDCGCWSAEKEAEVIAARTAIAQAIGRQS